MFYKFLTKEEKENLRAIKRNYPMPEDQGRYEQALKRYLEEINYEERLANYLKDKWYIKLIRWFTNRKKSKEM